jgi:hypothetical protein
MREYFLSTRIPKILGNNENEILEQLEKVEQIISELSKIDPIFKTWYINNATSSKPPLDYPFPSEKAKQYLFNLRKEDSFEIFGLWNGSLETEQFSSFSFDRTGLVMTFKKVLNLEQIIQLFKVVLEYPKNDYVYLNSYFFGDINVFPHRLETTSICYVPIKVDEKLMPHLYKIVDVNNDLNEGTILVFDEDWSDESNEMKKKVQENSLALVELNVIPEAELPENFFES